MTSVRVPRTSDERVARLEELLPYHLLWENAEFQRVWVGELMGKDIEALKQLEYRMSSNLRPEVGKLLDVMGLRTDTQEEQLRAFLAVRAVINYFEYKLTMMKRFAENFEKGRANDVAK